MKKGKWIFIAILIALILIGVAIYFYSNNVNNENDYTAQRTSTNEENTTNTENQNTQNTDNTSKDSANTTNTTNVPNTPNTNETNSATPKAPAPTEVTIASFSTKIYSKDSSRQNNIQITCNTLNNTIVNPGSTFSFCSTVGQATTSKGYQKADVYDGNGKKKQGLGGGNCQVSSTLYNAVLKVQSLVVTERHEHSNNVPYVQKGKDAAVAYGSYDFKFRNTSNNSIKILASTDGSYVYTSLVELRK